MFQPVPCTNCGWQTALLVTDNVFHFIVCERCGKEGPRAVGSEDAVSMWDSQGETLFSYGEERNNYVVIGKLECVERRDTARVSVDLPIVMAVGNPKGPRIKGRIRNISHYGAYLELKEGELKALPVKSAELKQLRTYLFLRPPAGCSGDASIGGKFLMMGFGPTHMAVSRNGVALGGRFLEQRQEHLLALDLLTGNSSTQDTAASA